MDALPLTAFSLPDAIDAATVESAGVMGACVMGGGAAAAGFAGGGGGGGGWNQNTG